MMMTVLYWFCVGMAILLAVRLCVIYVQDKRSAAGLKRWWLRRRHGIVKPPPGQRQGTTWYEHPAWQEVFECPCKTTLRFAPADRVIRSQEHVDGCQGLMDASTNRAADVATTRIMDIRRCTCPVTDARDIKICPECRIGHWRQAQ
jgi:hypothetical protein